MPSTYSPNLRLTLMADGEDSNTWGDITNVNLGTVLEDAIAGLVTIYMTNTDYVLSALAGSYDEARNMILVVNGTLAAQHNVICPAGATKLYVVINATSGGFPVNMISAATGSTGVVVPDGTAKLVYCDGTNVHEALTDVASLSIDAAPTQNMQVTNKQYVDAAISTSAGSTLSTSEAFTTAAVNAAVNSLTAQINAVSANGVTQNYVDTSVANSVVYMEGYVNNAISVMMAAVAAEIAAAYAALSAQIAAAQFPSGTKLIFNQASAPTGWVQLMGDSVTDRMLRINYNTGGGYGGSASPTVMNVVPTHTHGYTPPTVSVTDPGHAHTYTAVHYVSPGAGPNGSYPTTNLEETPTTTQMSVTGISVNLTGGSVAENSGTNWTPRYLDSIVCSKS